MLRRPSCASVLFRSVSPLLLRVLRSLPVVFVPPAEYRTRATISGGENPPRYPNSAARLFTTAAAATITTTIAIAMTVSPSQPLPGPLVFSPPQIGLLALALIPMSKQIPSSGRTCIRSVVLLSIFLLDRPDEQRLHHHRYCYIMFRSWLRRRF